MLAFLALLVVIVVASAGNLREQSGNTMKGDMYVFAYSWTPGFCYGQANYVGCQTPNSYWNKGFTIHGLWPQYSAGGYPASCTTEAFNASVPYDIGWSTMTTYWPNVQVAETDPTYNSFWSHEWSKHGTCSGLSQYNYFSDTINLAKKFGTPSVVTTNAGKTVSASSIRSGFGGSNYVALQCNGAILTGAYTCWSQSNSLPNQQIACTSEIVGEDTCKSTDVTIPVL